MFRKGIFFWFKRCLPTVCTRFRGVALEACRVRALTNATVPCGNSLARTPDLTLSGMLCEGAAINRGCGSYRCNTGRVTELVLIRVQSVKIWCLEICKVAVHSLLTQGKERAPVKDVDRRGLAGPLLKYDVAMKK